MFVEVGNWPQAELTALSHIGWEKQVSGSASLPKIGGLTHGILTKGRLTA